ncbi:MAG: alpha-N-acetylglucosaminidase N-terminal domain-containing protein [Bacteroidota bacterium]
MKKNKHQGGGIFPLPAISFSFLYFTVMNCVFAQNNPSDELIARVMPDQKNFFVTELSSSSEGKDVFEIETFSDNKIVLRGNGPLSVAVAFNWYLKYLANLSYDWQATTTLSGKDKLPLPERKIRRVYKDGNHSV